MTVADLLADASAADDPERARVLLERAVERAPANATARYRYGRRLVAAGDVEAAASQFEAALAAAPDHPGARNALAVRALRD
ncbi:MAG: tetratricopeptide repeat protein, partial [Haloferacaceae archaeon]